MSYNLQTFLCIDIKLRICLTGGGGRKWEWGGRVGMGRREKEGVGRRSGGGEEGERGSGEEECTYTATLSVLGTI